MYKILFLIIYVLGLSAFGQIQLSWEFDFDEAQIASADDYRIVTSRTNRMGYALLELKGGDTDMSVGHRLVLVDPSGGQIWLSDDLEVSYPSSFDLIVEILSLGEGTATVGVVHTKASDNDTTVETIIRFDQAASPQVSAIELTVGEFAAIVGTDGASGEPSFDVSSSKIDEGGFFTVSNPDANGDGTEFEPPTVLKRYVYSASPSVKIVSQAGVSAGMAHLIWESVAGEVYQVQESDDLIVWNDVGATLSGTGSTLTWVSSLQDTTKYFRIVRQ